ncbi:MAG: DUF502 domain-containing protein [bacterium]
MEKTNFVQKIVHFFKSLILQGLFTVLPIAATIFFVQFLYKTLHSWLTPLQQFVPALFKDIPGFEIILILFLLFLLGALLKFFLIETIIDFFENLIDKIPIIRTIYSSFKTLVDFFNVPDPAKETKKVVLIQFPRQGIYSIAFLLGSAQETYQKKLELEGIKTEEKMLRVFMPGSPNPTTGFFFVMAEKEIIPTDITFEEAIKIIVSCGLINPGEIKFKKN